MRLMLHLFESVQVLVASGRSFSVNQERLYACNEAATTAFGLFSVPAATVARPSQRCCKISTLEEEGA